MSIHFEIISSDQPAPEYLQELMALAEVCENAGAAKFIYRLNKPYFEGILNGNCIKVIAIDNNQVIGFGACEFFTKMPGYLEGRVPDHVHIGRSGYLKGALLHPDWRQKGLGHLLVEKRLEALKQQGGKDYVLATAHPENKPSIKALEKAGFTPLTTGRFFNAQVLRTLYLKALVEC